MVRSDPYPVQLFWIQHGQKVPDTTKFGSGPTTLDCSKVELLVRSTVNPRRRLFGMTIRIPALSPYL